MLVVLKRVIDPDGVVVLHGQWGAAAPRYQPAPLLVENELFQCVRAVLVIVIWGNWALVAPGNIRNIAQNGWPVALRRQNGGGTTGGGGHKQKEGRFFLGDLRTKH